MKVIRGSEFKKRFGTMFYKRLKQDMKSPDFIRGRSHQYQIGMNHDTVPFQEVTHIVGSANPGGEYSYPCKFHTGLSFYPPSMSNKYLWGPLVAHLEIPDDANVMVNPNKHFWDASRHFKADKLILTRTVDITQEDNFLQELEHSLDNGFQLEFYFAQSMMYRSIEKENIKCLEWLSNFTDLQNERFYMAPFKPSGGMAEYAELHDKPRIKKWFLEKNDWKESYPRLPVQKILLGEAANADARMPVDWIWNKLNTPL